MGLPGIYLSSLLCGASIPSALANPGGLLRVGEFSSAEVGGSLPQGWNPLTFEKIPEQTQYELVKDGGQVVVKATSHQSSSGLSRKIMINPMDYPVVEWRWKVQNILEGGDVTKKSGDDYPARLYITFEYDSSKVGFFEKVKYETIKLVYGQYPPIGAINYIWESNSPIGTVIPNPYTDRVHMFVTAPFISVCRFLSKQSHCRIHYLPHPAAFLNLLVRQLPQGYRFQETSSRLLSIQALGSIFLQGFKDNIPKKGHG